MDSNASPNERAGTPSRGLLRKESREAAAGASNASLPYAISIPSASSSVTSLPAANSPALPHRSPSQSSLSRSASHRHSFASSPRAQRHPSFTQAALQELLSNPPNSNRHADPRFAGRDWRDVAVGELISGDDVKWADLDMSVEEATKLLLKESSKNVVLVRETNASKIVHSTFDYADLNAYLLVVVGLARPEEHHVELYDRITLKARDGLDISLRELQPIFRKEPVDSLQAADSVDKAIEIFGGGVHLAVVLDDSGAVVGILSQLRLVEFFWNEGVHFQSIDRLYPINLRDLEIGTAGPHIVAVNSDTRLAEALTLMYDEGLTSVPVLDNGYNVVGNISTFDVRHLTSTSSAPLLQASCMHFLSIILSERGVEQGRDSFPVFYVNPSSTLAHTVAKLVATRAHRMWVVEGASPSASAPETPQLAPTAMSGSVPPSPLPVTVQNTVPASAMPGAHLSGRLSGVVSLTDILNTFAKSSGMNPTDPGELRARRRRSSSSSIRPSLDSSRTSFDLRR